MTKTTTAIKISAVVALLATTGCAEYQKIALNNTTPKGTEFTRALSEEYNMLGKTEQLVMFDEIDAYRYFTRGKKAANGCAVFPYKPTEWSIRKDWMPELIDARAHMMHVMAHGARTVAPEMSAHMQAHYDCWVEQSAEGWQKKDIKACKTEFYSALALVESMVLHQAPAAHVVLFELDEHKLNAEGMRVIDDAVMAASVPEFGRRIHVIGRTDRVGDDASNKSLSERRAKAVKDELVHRGIPESMISTKAAGETPGKFVDSDNRRVDILFLEYK